MLAFLRGLPDKFRLTPEMREHGAFAGSQAGNTLESIAELQTLIETFKPTPERLGLLGGRYKRLARDPLLSENDRRPYLLKSIKAYERGMDLDLNAYYCSSNLPRLYRQRGAGGDEQLAENVGQVVIAACERAIRQNTADPWVRATLLGAAFDAADIGKAEKLLPEIEEEGPASWQLESTLADLKSAIQYIKDEATRARFAALLGKLELLLA